MDVTLKIGKDGVDKIVNQADNQLKQRKEIKIKINSPLVKGRMSEFTRSIANDLAQKTKSSIVWVKGRTFVLRRD